MRQLMLHVQVDRVLWLLCPLHTLDVSFWLHRLYTYRLGDDVMSLVTHVLVLVGVEDGGDLLLGVTSKWFSW